MVRATPDDLLKPLGLDRPAARRRDLPWGRMAAAMLALAGLAAGLYVAAVGDPRGGEPQATVAIARTAAPVPASPVPDPAPAGQGAPKMRVTAAELESAAGVAVTRPDGQVPGAIIIQVPGEPTDRLAPAPDPRLVERTLFGLLPRIAPDGTRPADLYARRAGALPAGAAPAGRIALVVGGLGLSEGGTAAAVARLPRPVTLAFAPYGADLARAVASAREAGHEVMLQVPMEPFDYPDSNPGPHTLTTGTAAAENVERLHWLMGRFPGYVGIVNFMGGKFTADTAALTPALREIGARGLLYLDDGSSPRSVALAVAQGARTDAARAAVTLDGLTRAEAIDKELARLEKLARERGVAIGTASALPLAVERIARWAEGLEAKGLLLVPASAAFGGGGAGAEASGGQTRARAE